MTTAEAVPVIPQNIEFWVNHITNWADEKGWSATARNIPVALLLVHTEVSEAAEEWRANREETWYDKDGKMEGLPSELADIVIRVMHMCGVLGIDLEKTMQEKMEYNSTREHMHGGKRA